MSGFRLRRGLVLSCVLVAGFLARSSHPCALADEQRYSLGTIQEDDQLQVAPGNEGSTTIGFYNVDGTLPTEVEVVLLGVPAGWTASLDAPCPDQGLTRISIDGEHMSLRVPQTAVSATRLKCNDECHQSWWLEGRGYVCAVAATLRIGAPPSATAGTSATVGARIVATWPGVPGSMPQEREMTWQVDVVRGDNPTHSPIPLAALIAVVACVLAAALVRGLVKSPQV